MKAGNGVGIDRLLSVKHVAERLSVTTAAAYGLCAADRLPHVRILNVIRIAPSDLAGLITSCRVGNRGEKRTLTAESRRDALRSATRTG
jgi:hypothetical protein